MLQRLFFILLRVPMRIRVFHNGALLRHSETKDLYYYYTDTCTQHGVYLDRLYYNDIKFFTHKQMDLFEVFNLSVDHE